MPEFPIYIGYDHREQVAYQVASFSVRRNSRQRLDVKKLDHKELRKKGIFWRGWITSPTTGQWYDMVDHRPFSTEFSHTRFLVPQLMGYKGWALFMDCDMIFTVDIKRLLEMCDDRYAVMVVKHMHRPEEMEKMDGQVQQQYHRKNWSSFILWNCSHPSNKFLTPFIVNSLPGSDLHTFSWLKDTEIGSLPYEYNWIEEVSPVLAFGEKPKVIHYTNGGPWFENCQNVAYADLWTKEYERWQREEAGDVFTHIPTTKYEFPI